LRSTVLIILLAGILASCKPGPSGPWQENCQPLEISSDDLTSLTYGTGDPLFDDATVNSGTGHVHDLDGIDGFYEAAIGGGVAIEDFDEDGDLDIIVTGGIEDDGYYVNQGNGQFLDCADSAGINSENDWTLGVSMADFDNDGDQDVLMLNDGANRLLRNLGDGSFEDITGVSNIRGKSRSASASWADLDGDGLLDLFIANLASDFPLGATPDPDRSQLYRNLGSGIFEDVSEQVGNSGLRPGACYIAPMVDFDGDGQVDLLITQEFGLTIERNQIYRNLGPSESDLWLDWENKTQNANIKHPYAAMGVALFDLNQNLLPDVFMTNLIVDEPLREVLLKNNGNFVFEDITETIGASQMRSDPANSFHRTASWAALQLDFDNDGDEDLYTIYGAITPGPFPGMTCENSPPLCGGQPNGLLRNDNNTQFTELEGTGAEDHGVGRGVAAADINGDGCLDLFVVNQNSPSRLLLSKCDHSNRSITLELEGTVSNRDAVGAVVKVQTENQTQVKFVTAGATSVHSAQPFGIHIGVGQAETIDTLTINWPSGVQDIFEAIDVGTMGSSNRLKVVEGSGIVSP
jgi:hypothetical protein